MRLPDYIKSCICFLCVETEQKLLYGGTGFFVGVPSSFDPNSLIVFLVTAKHCVLKAYSKYGNLKARLNLYDGSGSHLFELNQKDWISPQDLSVDIAVMPVNLDSGMLDVLCLDTESFVDEAKIHTFGIGIGDDTATVGLFTQRCGKNLNIPIVRCGTIAAMPEELIFDSQTAAEYHAYLVEMRSIGGLSGSPVFVSIPPHRAFGMNAERPNDGYSIPLGIVRSHWDQIVQSPVEDFINEGSMNMGMAAVIPIQELTKLLYTDEQVITIRSDIDLALASGKIRTSFLRASTSQATHGDS